MLVINKRLKICQSKGINKSGLAIAKDKMDIEAIKDRLEDSIERIVKMIGRF